MCVWPFGIDVQGQSRTNHQGTIRTQVKIQKATRPTQGTPPPKIRRDFLPARQGATKCTLYIPLPLPVMARPHPPARALWTTETTSPEIRYTRVPARQSAAATSVPMGQRRGMQGGASEPLPRGKGGHHNW